MLEALIDIGHAVAAYQARIGADPDETPQVCVRAAHRNLSCKESGPECYRRVLYPGATETEWPDSDRLPRCDGRADTRRATVRADVPIGTIVQQFERDVHRGKRGRCSRSYGIVTQAHDGRTLIAWLGHRTLRKRRVDEVDGGPLGKIEIARPE